MNRDGELERTARPSVIDRLIDLAPREATDVTWTRDESVRAYRSSVLRDIEWLLNTRRTTVRIPASLKELSGSAFAYGLPDVSSMSADSTETRGTLIRQIEAAIRQFEPRLTEIRVSLAESLDSERRIHFTIEGLLKMEPEPERVVFDTILEIASGDFSVKSAS